MTRTYLKSSSSMLTKKPTENDPKSKAVAAPVVRGLQASNMKTDWRGKPQWDDTLDSPEIVLKSKNIRKPLQPLRNITPSLFTDMDSSPELNLRRSVQSKQAAAVDDTFDKLFDNVPEKTDPFDKLFENVDKKAANDPFDRLLTDLTPNPSPTNHSLYHSVFTQCCCDP